MRRSIAAVALVLCALALLPAVPASAAAKKNWVLHTFEAGLPGEYTISEWRTIKFSGRGPWVLGFAVSVTYGGPGDYSEAIVATIGGDDFSLRTSSGAGGVHQRFDPVVDLVGEGSKFELRLTYKLRLNPGLRFSTVWFFPNASMTVRSTSISPSHSFNYSRVVSGTGATAMLVADPRSRGTSASIGAIGAGSAVYRASAKKGIVGGIEKRCHCTGTWSGPGRASGSFTSVSGDGVPAPANYWEGDFAFAGPSGRWAWNWMGTSDATVPALSGATTPVIGAWAPIGNDWRLFDHMRPAEPPAPI